MTVFLDSLTGPARLAAARRIALLYPHAEVVLNGRHMTSRQAHTLLNRLEEAEPAPRALRAARALASTGFYFGGR